MPNTKIFSTVSPLRAYRVQTLGMSAELVARECGLHKATYCRLEVGGDRVPRKDHLNSVMGWLKKKKSGLTLEHLIFPERFASTIKLVR